MIRKEIWGGIEVHYEYGHTIEEWEVLSSINEDLWDFPIEELKDGTIEPNADILYWVIGDRVYETPFEM